MYILGQNASSEEALHPQEWARTNWIRNLYGAILVPHHSNSLPDQILSFSKVPWSLLEVTTWVQYLTTWNAERISLILHSEVGLV